MPARVPHVDVVAAVLLTAVGVAEVLLDLTGAAEPWFVACTVPFVTLPVAVRRRRPITALLVVLAAMLAQTLAGSELAGGFAEPLALVLVLYAVGSLLPLRPSAALAAVALFAMSVVVAAGGHSRAGNYVYVATLVLAAWLAGRGVRLTAERRDLLAERRATQERSRIARELHDVVSHNVSAIVVLAGAERRDLPTDSPVAATLSGIEEHGRQTLTELRRLLGLLRVDDADAPLVPQPRLDDLPALVESSGVAATLRTVGEPVPVTDGQELTIYRVVQESLTNVRKHASTQAAQVVLRWSGAEVEVEVVNPGGARHDRSVPGTGYGLQAMRERVRAYGGRVVEAGPTTDGFRVRVAIPVAETP
jgi:signal transduction histidine kinase